MNELTDPEAVKLREAYLFSLGRHLRSYLSAIELDETIREVGAHLDASAAARVESGSEPGAAMRAAIEQFGPANKVAHGVVAASRPGYSTSLFCRYAVIATLYGASIVWLADGFCSVVGFTGQVLTSLDLAVGGFFGLVGIVIAWHIKPLPRRFGMAWGLCPAIIRGGFVMPALLTAQSYVQPLIALLVLTWAGYDLAFMSAKLADKAHATDPPWKQLIGEVANIRRGRK